MAEKVINSGCISTNWILSSIRMTETLDINTVWSPRFIHIISNSVKRERGCISQYFGGWGGGFNSNDFLLLGKIKLSNYIFIGEKKTQVIIVELVQLSLSFSFILFNIKGGARVYLSACLGRPCCGDGSCAFPACRAGRGGERRGGGAEAASAGPACGGSGGRGPPGETLWKRHHTGAA